MNARQLRQNLEILLKYYNYGRDSGGLYTREPNPSAPGFYYQDGTLIGPAFYLQGSQRVPSNWDVKGLEVILEENPKIRQRPMIGSGIIRWQTWTVLMRHYEPGESVMPYQRKVERHFAEDCETVIAQRKDEQLYDRVMLHITTKDYDLRNQPYGAEGEDIPSPIEESPIPSFFDQ